MSFAPLRRVLPALVLAVLAVAPAAAQAPCDALDRTVLPIAEPKHAPFTELDARNAKAPPRFEVKAPAGAPNVLVVLVDDMGFGMPSAFGGPLHMPAADRLASQGLRYNQFHTTAVCSPTRTAAFRLPSDERGGGAGRSWCAGSTRWTRSSARSAAARCGSSA